MGIKKWFYMMLLCSLVGVMTSGKAHALWKNDDGTFSLTGKFETRETIRTQDSSGNTFPDTDAGDLVQQRNILDLEVNHNLGNLGGLQVKYHLLGRFFYEGIYDYGPMQFRDVYDNNKTIFDDNNLRTDARIREGYVDLSHGPLFFRLGKQNLSWGETDVMRLLDNINPLDNSFGGIFEDLDDRRIPLEMTRGSFNFGDVGPVKSFTLEGFWVPGRLDPTVSPVAPYGSPYAAPAPPSTNITPHHDMDNSRYGGRVQGVVGDDLTFSLAHYKTFLDTPAMNLHVFKQFDPLNPAGGFVVGPILTHEKVDITGGSINYVEHNLDVVIRSEVAMFWDEPVFIPQINTPDPTIALAVPGDPTTAYPIFNEGKVPTKNILRYSLGLDKQQWIRALNEDSTFYISFQYLGQYVCDYDKRMALIVPTNAAPPFTYPDVKKFDHTFTLLAKNSWLHGTLTPQMVLGWYTRGAYLIQPSVEYILDPFRIKLQYSCIAGTLNGFGLFRDRDQASLTIGVLF